MLEGFCHFGPTVRQRVVAGFWIPVVVKIKLKSHEKELTWQGYRIQGPGCPPPPPLYFGRTVNSIVNSIQNQGGRLCPPPYYLLPPPDFQTFLRPCSHGLWLSDTCLMKMSVRVIFVSAVFRGAGIGWAYHFARKIFTC